MGGYGRFAETVKYAVVFIEATLGTMDEAYKKIGELTGDANETDKLAEYCKEISDKADKISGALAEDQKVTVYEALGDSGLNTNARGSFHAEVIDKVGGVNAADGKLFPWVRQ